MGTDLQTAMAVENTSWIDGAVVANLDGAAVGEELGPAMDFAFVANADGAASSLQNCGWVNHTATPDPASRF